MEALTSSRHSSMGESRRRKRVFPEDAPQEFFSGASKERIEACAVEAGGSDFFSTRLNIVQGRVWFRAELTLQI